jgi:hypothetical protein
MFYLLHLASTGILLQQGEYGLLTVVAVGIDRRHSFLAKDKNTAPRFDFHKLAPTLIIFGQFFPPLVKITPGSRRDLLNTIPMVKLGPRYVGTTIEKSILQAAGKNVCMPLYHFKPPILKYNYISNTVYSLNYSRIKVNMFIFLRFFIFF